MRANVAEEGLEIFAQPRLGLRPRSRVARCMAAGRTLPSRSAFKMSLRASGLPRGVEHREHAMRAVDARRRHHHDMASVEQEVGEAAALRGIVIAEHRQQMLAHVEDPGLRRRQSVVGGLHARGARIAHMGPEESFVRLPQRQTLTAAPPLCGRYGRQHPLVRPFAFVLVEVADDAKYDGERGEALQAIDHLQHARRTRERPARESQGGGLAGLDEQHGAEEVFVAPPFSSSRAAATSSSSRPASWWVQAKERW